MTYTVEALGDFMRVGPQVYPERPNAVQVIMRGPHGKRLAADPVRTREGRARGSGFRTWIEQLNVPANESWNPPQKVVGLLGLGGAAEADRDTKVKLTAWAKSLNARSQTVAPAMASPLEAEIRAATSNLDMFQPWDDSDALSVAARVLSWGMVDTSRYDSSQTVRANLQRALLNVRIRTGVREGRIPTAPERDVSVAAEFGKNVASSEFVSDVGRRGVEILEHPAAVFDVTGKDSVVRRGYGGTGKGYEGSGTALLLKVAAVAGVGLAIYALASGYGKGLATRRFTPPPKET